MYRLYATPLLKKKLKKLHSAECQWWCGPSNPQRQECVHTHTHTHKLSSCKHIHSSVLQVWNVQYALDIKGALCDLECLFHSFMLRHSFSPYARPSHVFQVAQHPGSSLCITFCLTPRNTYQHTGTQNQASLSEWCSKWLTKHLPPTPPHHTHIYKHSLKYT